MSLFYHCIALFDIVYHWSLSCFAIHLDVASSWIVMGDIYLFIDHCLSLFNYHWWSLFIIVIIVYHWIHLDVTSSWIVMGDMDRVAVWLVLADWHLCTFLIGLKLYGIGSNYTGGGSTHTGLDQYELVICQMDMDMDMADWHLNYFAWTRLDQFGQDWISMNLIYGYSWCLTIFSFEKKNTENQYTIDALA